MVEGWEYRVVRIENIIVYPYFVLENHILWAWIFCETPFPPASSEPASLPRHCEADGRDELPTTARRERAGGGLDYASLHVPYFSLKILCKILPEPVRGISSSFMKSTDFGLLNPAILPLVKSIISFASSSLAS
jgi:hypothetical protein